MAIRVAIADDSLLVREWIIHVLERAPQIDVVSASSDHDELLRARGRYSELYGTWAEDVA